MRTSRHTRDTIEIRPVATRDPRETREILPGLTRGPRGACNIPPVGARDLLPSDDRFPSLHDDPQKIHQLLDLLILPPGTEVRVTTVAASVIVR